MGSLISVRHFVARCLIFQAFKQIFADHGDGGKRAKVDKLRMIAAKLEDRLAKDLMQALRGAWGVFRDAFQELGGRNASGNVSLDDLSEVVKEKITEMDFIQEMMNGRKPDIFNEKHRRGFQMILIFGKLYQMCHGDHHHHISISLDDIKERLIDIHEEVSERFQDFKERVRT